MGLLPRGRRAKREAGAYGLYHHTASTGVSSGLSAGMGASITEDDLNRFRMFPFKSGATHTTALDSCSHDAKRVGWVGVGRGGVCPGPECVVACQLFRCGGNVGRWPGSAGAIHLL